MDALWLALSAIVTALIVAAGGLVQSHLTARQLRAAKEQDYERQDEVAAKADVVAEKAAEAAELLLAANERVAEQTATAAEVTNGKLKVIHSLVNSAYEAQMKESEVALRQQAVLYREVIRLNRDAGRPPSPEAEAALTAIETRADELSSQLADRATAAAEAKAQVDG